MSKFFDKLAAAVTRTGAPVVVGLDPRWEQLPAVFRSDEPSDFQKRADAYVAFCRGIIDVVAPLVPAVKPQAAFFEQCGPAGMVALGKVSDYAREKGLLVILDGKRNDIGSTAEAYAKAYLGRDGKSPWQADSLTISPYLGADSLEPFFNIAQQHDAGVFVLVKTSNPGGGMLQDKIADMQPLYRHVAEYVEAEANTTAGQSGYGVAGAVVGATYPEQLSELRAAMPHSWFLVPGFGSQGGTAKDVAGAFDCQGLGAIVNNSRGIIFAHSKDPYGDRFGESEWQQAIEAATLEMIAQLRAETPAAKLVD